MLSFNELLSFTSIIQHLRTTIFNHTNSTFARISMVMKQINHNSKILDIHLRSNIAKEKHPFPNQQRGFANQRCGFVNLQRCFANQRW